MIKDIFTKGKSFSTPSFKIYFIVGDNDVNYALSVSGKLGIAVKRNRAKRVVREALRRAITKPFNMVISLKKAEISYYEAIKELSYFQDNINHKESITVSDRGL